MGAGRERFAIDTSASAVLVQARSNVGPVTFGSTSIRGVVEAAAGAGRLDLDPRPTAQLSLPVSSLVSGNALYDAELQKRLAARLHPQVAIELLETTGGGGDYAVSGTVTIHGVTATLHGSVRVTLPEPDVLSITGEHVIDIREFDIEVPSVLMLRIYPDVTVGVQLLARRSAA